MNNLSALKLYIDSVRIKRGITHTFLAESMGVSKSMLSHLFSGRRKISDEHIFMLAGALNLKASDLFDLYGRRKKD